MSSEGDLILFACANYINTTQELLLTQLLLHRSHIIKRRQRFIKRLTRKLQQNCAHYLNKIMSTLGEFTINIPREKRRKTWAKSRSNHWWYAIVNNEDFDDQMVENFRMNRDSFQYICERLYPELAPHPRSVRKPLSVDMKVAIALYKLASCCEYRVVGNQFGVHKSTVQRCLYDFCNAVIKVLLKEEIKMPNGDEALMIINDFKERSGIPQIIGAIDGTHIPVTAPLDGHADYINRKGWTSVVLQGLVDCNYRFMDITCKHPGSAHDALVLKDSFLAKNIDQPTDVIDGVEIPAFFIGDPAYPLLPWLIKGYSGSLSATEESFNAYLNKARITVENAFGRLKGRWRILQKRMDIDVNFVPRIVATCCVLHNILERRKSPYIEAWNDSVEFANTIFIQPSSQSQMFSLDGSDIRNHLKDYMARNFPIIKSQRN